MTPAFRLYTQSKRLLKKIISYRSRQADHVLWREAPWRIPGHYYSSIPALDDIRQREASIWGPLPTSIPGIDLHEAEQLQMLETFRHYYAEMPPYQETAQPGLRYFFDNVSFSYGDAISLFCMIRYLNPKRIIEIGSGYTSALMLDINERFFDNQIKLVFIEPYPDTLFSLLKPGDKARCEILQQPLAAVDSAYFQQLEAGDLLFVDSTHVAKVGSDVNTEVFQIYPALQQGVYIHIHDIFYPFEYPKSWIYEGRAWTECYLVRAFLEYNSAFNIVYFNDYMAHMHYAPLAHALPLATKNTGGSLYLKKG